jgi:DNA-3-methyladenine glycosylase II
VLHAVVGAAGPMRLRPDDTRSPFESLARAIANQQLSGTVASRILERFVALAGARGAFPRPERVLALEDEALRGVGFSWAKVACLKDLARRSLDGTVPDSRALERLDDGAIIERLTQVRGVGRWTVEMLLIFQLGRPDVLPVDDFGVRNGFRAAYRLRGLPTPRALADFGERWRPHRTAAAWYLWRAVELERDGRLPVAARAPRVRCVKRRAV